MRWIRYWGILFQKNYIIFSDVPIKGCEKNENDETLYLKGCCKFYEHHIVDSNKILIKFKDFHLTLSGAKSMFGMKEVLIVGHIFGSYECKPSIKKVETIQIQIMKNYTNTT